MTAARTIDRARGWHFAADGQGRVVSPLFKTEAEATAWLTKANGPRTDLTGCHAEAVTTTSTQRSK